MRKLSQINEGLWNKGLNRTKSGEKRIEDKTIFDNYLKTVEWVDMGHEEYLFAKEDMSELLSLNQIKDFINIKPDNIHFMNKDLIDFLNSTCENLYYKNEPIEKYNSNKTNNIITFFTKSEYFIKISYEDHFSACVETNIHRRHNVSLFDKPLFRVKLIKEKIRKVRN